MENSNKNRNTAFVADVFLCILWHGLSEYQEVLMLLKAGEPIFAFSRQLVSTSGVVVAA